MSKNNVPDFDTFCERLFALVDELHDAESKLMIDIAWLVSQYEEYLKQEKRIEQVKKERQE